MNYLQLLITNVAILFFIAAIMMTSRSIFASSLLLFIWMSLNINMSNSFVPTTGTDHSSSNFIISSASTHHIFISSEWLNPFLPSFSLSFVLIFSCFYAVILVLIKATNLCYFFCKLRYNKLLFCKMGLITIMRKGCRSRSCRRWCWWATIWWLLSSRRLRLECSRLWREKRRWKSMLSCSCRVTYGLGLRWLLNIYGIGFLLWCKKIVRMISFWNGWWFDFASQHRRACRL